MARLLRCLAVFVMVVMFSVVPIVVSVSLNLGLKFVIMEALMSRRRSLHKGVSQRMFTKHAMRVHPFNSNVMSGPGGPMRGGIRL